MSTETTPAPAGATMTAADLVKPLAASMPAAPPGVVIAMPPAAAPEEKDIHGRAFDPGKFRQERDSLGRWKNLKPGPGRPGKSALPESAKSAPESAPHGTAPESAPAGVRTGFIGPESAPVPVGGAFIAADPPPAKAPDKYTVAAGLCVTAAQSGLVMLGQEEGLLEPAERIALSEATEAVLRKYDKSDIPPEAALVLTVLAIVAPRLAKPKTQTTLQRFRAWLWLKWTAFRGAQMARRVEHVQAS